MVTPAWVTGFAKRSTSWTVTAGVMAMPAVVSVGCCTKCIRVAVAARFWRLNVAWPAAPDVVALTWKMPGCELAVNIGDVANPSAPVVTVGLPLNVTLAPAAGGVNVTWAPGTG